MMALRLLLLGVGSSMVLALLGCSGRKSIQNNPPFEISEVTAQNWVGGMQGGGSGITLKIDLKYALPEDVTLDSVYTKEGGAKWEAGNSPQTFVAHLKTHQNQRDLIISSDPNEEFKNVLPKKKPAKAKGLLPNECVISYTFNTKSEDFLYEDLIILEDSRYPIIQKQN